MAVLNFPDTSGQPTDGSFVYVENGVTYSWDGTKWEANSSTAFDGRYVEKNGDNMTGDLTLGTDKITLYATSGSAVVSGELQVAPDGNSGFYLGDKSAVDSRPESDGKNGARIFPSSITASRSDDGVVFQGRTVSKVGAGTNDYTSTIYGDGSATFASTIKSEGQIRGNRFKCGSNANQDNILLNADGTAEFQSYVTSRRAAGGGVAAAVCALNSSSGSYSTVGTTYGIVTEQTSGTGCFLGANGNATFSGNIIAGSVTTDRIASNSSGSKPDESPIITIYRQGISTSNPGVEIYTNRIYTSGTVTATNTVFNLDPDNGANYVSTTDAEGNESRVYNGPTLDVKERLTKADNALQTLKTAAAAAVDFAELKAAIATALADI